MCVDGAHRRVGQAKAAQWSSCRAGGTGGAWKSYSSLVPVILALKEKTMARIPAASSPTQQR